MSEDGGYDGPGTFGVLTFLIGLALIVVLGLGILWMLGGMTP